MIRVVTISILLAGPAQAYTTHCQRNGGPVYACHICTRGHNAMTLTEYECSAREERRQREGKPRRRPV